MAVRIQRFWRHFWAPNRKKVLDDAALQRLGAHVARSEAQHRGEIRICVEARLPESYLMRPHDMPRIVRQRAVTQFAKLRVWDTEDNNGVLIYLLLVERSIEIVADRGISRHVTPQEWQQITANLAQELRQGRFEAGLMGAVDAISVLLARHFAPLGGAPNPNELPDIPHASE